MEPAEHLAALRQDAAAVALATRGDLHAPVPSCPAWRVGELVVHLGVVQRWAAEVVRSRTREAVRGATRRWGVEPTGPGLAERFEEGADELLSVLEAAPPDEQVWSWSVRPDDARARFWTRRMAQEQAIHRWDAELAFGEPRPIEADLAADGVDEALTVMAPFLRQRSERRGEGETYHFHRSDGEGEWLVSFEGEGLRVSEGHAKGDVAVRGPAELLFLFLWHRVPADRLDVAGDPHLLDRWFELVPPA